MGSNGASPGFAWFSKMLVRPSSRIGSLATTPIRIGSKLNIAGIEPLLAWINERWGGRTSRHRRSCSTLSPDIREAAFPGFSHFCQAVVTDGIVVLITLK
jgi:hypothetical protein